MLIYLKNKDTLIYDDFKFRCCIGKNGLSKNKVEGDKCTPKGTFNLGYLYFRKDRNPKPQTKCTIKVITKKMGWCDDVKSQSYNKQISINKFINHEKFFKRDLTYDYLIVVKYNTKKIIPNK